VEKYMTINEDDVLKKIAIKCKRYRHFDTFLNATDEELAEQLDFIEIFTFDRGKESWLDRNGFYPVMTRKVTQPNKDSFLLKNKHTILIFGVTNVMDNNDSDCVVSFASNHNGKLVFSVSSFKDNEG
jgi:hypothetical protein